MTGVRVLGGHWLTGKEGSKSMFESKCYMAGSRAVGYGGHGLGGVRKDGCRSSSGGGLGGLARVLACSWGDGESENLELLR